MSNDREFELKFALDPGSADELLQHPRLREAARERQPTRTVSTYFDTLDGVLRSKRVSLRVRRSGARTVQTLKHAGRSMVDRDEWEHEGGGPRPDLSWLQATPLGDLFGGATRIGPLEARFSVDVSRTTLPLSSGTTAIEGALDRGVIEADGRSLKVSEFELELKKGRDRVVVDLAREIARDLPLVLSLSTKAERGYAVADGTWDRPPPDLTLDLSTARTLREVFTSVMEACLHFLCRNAALIGPVGAIGSGDEVAVHKTRIALRHLRAALALFRPMLRRKGVRALDAEVRWMSDRLGAARDADVFQRAAFDGAARSPALAALMQDWRAQAHEALRTALASSRWRLLLIDLLAFSMDGVRRTRRGAPAGRFVRRRLAAHRAKLARRARGWSTMPHGAVHRLRKDAKMLRYAFDLFATVPKLGARRRPVRKLGRALHAMQQALGTVHDAVALREHLGEVVLRRDAPPGMAADAWREARAEAVRLAGATAQDNKALGDARRAAQRVRHTSAF